MVVLWILYEITEYEDPVKEANIAQVIMLNYTTKCHPGVSTRLVTIIILTVHYFRFERTRTVSFPYAACRGSVMGTGPERQESPTMKQWRGGAPRRWHDSGGIFVSCPPGRYAVLQGTCCR
jgi:hypothetical protein